MLQNFPDHQRTRISLQKDSKIWPINIHSRAVHYFWEFSFSNEKWSRTLLCTGSQKPSRSDRTPTGFSILGSLCWLSICTGTWLYLTPPGGSCLRILCFLYSSPPPHRAEADPKFAENCMKMKKNWTEGSGRASKILLCRSATARHRSLNPTAWTGSSTLAGLRFAIQQTNKTRSKIILEPGGSRISKRGR